MRVGVAYRDAADSTEAGAAVARAALADGGLEGCDVFLVFATAEHDFEALHAGIRSVTGPGPRLVGGNAVGALTNEALGYGGHQVGAAAIVLDGVGCELIAEDGLADNERDTGRRIGARFTGDPDAPLLLLYDAINRTGERMKLNMATPLLRGVREVAGCRPRLVGAGLCGDMTGSPTWQLVDDRVAQQTAMALAFSGELTMDAEIMHGCHPAGDYRTVTRVDGPVVLEIDGRPAVEVVQDMLGASVAPEEYGFFVTLGMNMGDLWAPFDESNYVNRLCLKVDRRRGGLVMFEPDIAEGTTVQFMHRNVRLDYIAPRVEALFERLDGRRPVFALYIDCAGRAAGYAGMDDEEAAAVQAAVAGRAPLLGFYCGVEIGPVVGRPTPLDWTGVLCLFSVPA